VKLTFFSVLPSGSTIFFLVEFFTVRVNCPSGSYVRSFPSLDRFSPSWTFLLRHLLVRVSQRRWLFLSIQLSCRFSKPVTFFFSLHCVAASAAVSFPPSRRHSPGPWSLSFNPSRESPKDPSFTRRSSSVPFAFPVRQGLLSFPLSLGPRLHLLILKLGITVILHFSSVLMRRHPISLFPPRSSPTDQRSTSFLLADFPVAAFWVFLK